MEAVRGNKWKAKLEGGLALSRVINEDGREIEIIEALRYPDGSISVQGHPEEGATSHIFNNFLDLCFHDFELANDSFSNGVDKRRRGCR